jgi:hypothetical protein
LSRAGAGDRDDARGLAALASERVSALVKTALSAPRDLDHARVLAALATRDRATDRGLVAVVMGRHDEQPAGVD